MHLLDLAPELLLSVATHLTQVDLLNVSLTHSRLRNVTEPELFREYSNTHMYGRSFKAFIFRLIERPDLAKHVRRADLRAYKHLSYFHPEHEVRRDCFTDQCTELQYMTLTQAAIASGVIETAAPFEPESSLLQTMWIQQQMFDEDDREGWQDYFYDQDVHIENVPYEAKFCKLLRTGIDEPLVILLLALLPNLRYLDLYGTPHVAHSLEWRNAHAFRSLERLTACATDHELEWPIAFFNHVLRAGNVQTLEVYRATGGWKEDSVGMDMMVDAPMIPVPICLLPESTRITRLTLQYCTLSRADMQILLLACKTLAHLYYSTGDSEVGPENFTLPELGALLEPHKQSLQSLHLAMAESWDFDAPLGTLPTLCGFSRLTGIDVDLAAWSDILLGPLEEDLAAYDHLFLTFLAQLDAQDPLEETTEKLRDRLPPSLTRLTLREYDDTSDEMHWDYRQVEHLVLERGAVLPNLKLVEVVKVAMEIPIYPRLVELARTTMNGANGLCWLVNSTEADYLSHNYTVFQNEQGNLRTSMSLVQWKEGKYISLDGKSWAFLDGKAKRIPRPGHLRLDDILDSRMDAMYD